MAGGSTGNVSINQIKYMSAPLESALIIPSDAHADIIAAARASKATLGELVQILDGVNDNAMFAAALAALPSSMCRINIAEGNVYGLNVDLSSKQYLTISGQGEGVTILHGVFRCQPAIEQTGYNFEHFSMDGGGAGTAFSMANLRYTRFENLYLEDYDYCFDMNHTTFDRWIHVDMRNVNIRLFYFYGGGNPIIGGNDHYLNGVTYDSDGADRPDAIETAGTGALIMHSCDFIHCGTGLHINPAAGETAEWFLIEQTYFDLGADSGLLIEGAGIVRGIFFNNVWFATNGQAAGGSRDGVVVNCALADGVVFSDCHCHNNYGTGYYFQAGSNIKVKGGEVSGNNAGVINANGIYINAQVEVNGVYLGRTFTWLSDPDRHIYLDAGADAIIKNNVFDANVLVEVILRQGTYLIEGNEGYPNSGARAWRNGNQAINSGALTQIQLNAETYDNHGEFNTGTYQFVAGEAGLYLLQAQVCYQASVVGTRYVAEIHINGAGCVQTSFQAAAVDLIYLPLSDVQWLAAGDVVTLLTQHWSGAARNVQGAVVDTFLCVNKVSS